MRVELDTLRAQTAAFFKWYRFASPEYLNAQIELVEAEVGRAFFISWVTALLLGLIFFRTNALPVWGIWFGVYSVLSGFMLVRYRRGRIGEHMELRHRVWFMVGAMGMVGALWGSTTLLLQVTTNDLPTLFLVSAVVAGVSSATLAYCAHCWPVYAAYILMVIPMTALGFVVHGGPSAMTFVVFSVMYLLFLLQFGRTFETASLRSIKLRFENQALLKSLRQQTLEAQEARDSADVARAQAEASNIDKSRFLASASHDLRQPIHALGLFLEALGVTALNEKQRSIFDKALAASEASRSMLGTLLDFSRLDAGVVKFDPHHFSLQAVLADICQEYAQQAEDKGLVLRYRDTQWAVWSDPFLVSLIVRNFISNAVRYTTNGGLLVGCRRRDKNVLIEVWDTGIGIDPDEHQNIFKEFMQLANSERDRTRGLGLGLAIVDGLCKVIGATVSLQSAPGRGSVFRLCLPLSTEVALNPHSVDTNQLPLVQGLRVLVVDDDASVADSMQQLLQSWGCRCHVATSLPEARALALPDAPDVLLTDYRLQGGVTGRDVINAMRERWGASLRCVIVTGDTAPDRLRDAHNSGAHLLHKPLSANQLLAALAVPPAKEAKI